MSGSATIWRTVMRGLSDAYGSWKTICMSVRILRVSALSSGSTSRPSNSTWPLVAVKSFSARRAVVDLPQPDSPTSPNVCPRCTSNVTPSTARTVPTRRRRIAPFVTGKCLVRSRTSSSVSGPAPGRPTTGSGPTGASTGVAETGAASTLTSRTAVVSARGWLGGVAWR